MSGYDDPLSSALPALSPGIAKLLERTAIVVATHWRRPLGGHWVSGHILDQVAPLNQEGLITRLLKSLQALHDRPQIVLLLITSTEPGTETSAIWHADRVRGRFPDLPLALWTPTHVRSLHGLLRASDHADWIAWFDTSGYPRIRNMQLLVPHLLECELVVMLDDDEVVEDPFFLRRAAATVVHGASCGERVYGAASYYLDEHGSRLHEVPSGAASNPNPFECKAALMNGALERMEAQPGGVVPSTFALGGNMTFSRTLLQKVGFDPAIARGEDIDYVINARLLGLPYHFDKHRPIRHLPPAGRSYRDFDYGKLQQDVRRFIYERAKLQMAAADGRFAPLGAEDLKPYPGELLGDDLEQHAIASLNLHRPSTLDSTILEPGAFVEQALEKGRLGAEAFLHFAQTWPQALDVLSRDRAVLRLVGRILP